MLKPEFDVELEGRHTMSLWWLQPGWTQTKCACGATIWPEGDPDWGACYSCFGEDLAAREAEREHYERIAYEEAEYYRQLEEESPRGN